LAEGYDHFNPNILSLSNKTVPTVICIGLNELGIEQYLIYITEETVFHTKTVSFTFLSPWLLDLRA